MKTNRHVNRILNVEALEKRELLAGDLACPVGLPPEVPQMEDRAIVQTQTQTRAVAADVGNAQLQLRSRASEDSETGAGDQKRPRDRDSENSLVTTQATPVNGQADSALATGAQRGNGGGSQVNPTDSLTDDEIDTLLYMRGEEKLARDVYLAMSDTWGLPIFSNIAESEQRHMDSIGQLIEKYGLADPVVDDTPGEFTSETFQQLYDDLVSDGNTSQLAALKVGAFIEELDILDLQDALSETSHSDIESVYENLLRGSRNHLRSFVTQIEASGETYEPVLMTGEMYEEIISGDQETRNGNRRGESTVETRSRSGQPTLEASPAGRDQFFARFGHQRGK